MKNSALIFAFILAQFSFGQDVLKADLKLKIESSSGNNGLAVAYNKKKNIYYTVYAGNASYSLEVHNSLGKSIFNKAIGEDIRGFWFNDAKNQIEGILYDNQGSFVIPIDENGYPTTIISDHFTYQQDGQSVANWIKGNVYFMDNSGVSKFKQNSTNGKRLNNSAIFNTIGIDNINVNGLMLTGMKKRELGVFDYNAKKIYLINEKKGTVSKEYKVDLYYNFDIPSFFNVSCANGHAFLYNKTDRTWYGYKL